MDFSGTLFAPISTDSLTEARERQPVTAWIFHHDRMSAHRSVDVIASVRVWISTAALPA
jgi:hypothetical protein